MNRTTLAGAHNLFDPAKVREFNRDGNLPWRLNSGIADAPKKYLPSIRTPNTASQLTPGTPPRNRRAVCAGHATSKSLAAIEIALSQGKFE